MFGMHSGQIARIAMQCQKTEVAEYVRNNAGSHFDSALVDLFLDLVKDEP